MSTAEKPAGAASRPHGRREPAWPPPGACSLRRASPQGPLLRRPGRAQAPCVRGVRGHEAVEEAARSLLLAGSGRPRLGGGGHRAACAPLFSEALCARGALCARRRLASEAGRLPGSAFGGLRDFPSGRGRRGVVSRPQTRPLRSFSSLPPPARLGSPLRTLPDRSAGLPPIPPPSPVSPQTLTTSSLPRPPTLASPSLTSLSPFPPLWPVSPASAPHTCLYLGLFAHSPRDNLTVS